MIGSNEILGGGGINHIAINVKDFDKSVKFYKEVLGFKEVTLHFIEEQNQSSILLDTGNGSCIEMFSRYQEHSEDIGHFLHLAFETTKQREVLEKVRAAGMEVTMEPKDIELGGDPPILATAAYFNGPSGEPIALFQYR
jgi:glyoxylase I family protein